MASEKAEAPTAPAGEERKQQGTPVSVPQVPLPDIHVPGRVLWWGGLAALATLGVVDWPVAVLVGAGSWVAEQYAKAAQSQRAEQQQQ